MKLWTIQNEDFFEKLNKQKIITTGQQPIEENFKWAYDWLKAKMAIDTYPIWAWYQWEGKQKRRDLRSGGFAKRGTKMVQLHIEIDDDQILLSDFDLFHYVLNYWYLPLDDADDSQFEKLCADKNISFDDLQNFKKASPDLDRLRQIIINSWDRIFDLTKEDEYIYGTNDQKSIQATFSELSIDQVFKVEHFVAK